MGRLNKVIKYNKVPSTFARIQMVILFSHPSPLFFQPLKNLLRRQQGRAILCSHSFFLIYKCKSNSFHYEIMAPAWLVEVKCLGPGHTACKPSLDSRSPQLFSSCFSTFPSAPQALTISSGSQRKAQTSLVIADECGCPKGSPSSPIEDSLALCFSQQPPFPGPFSGAHGQHVSHLLLTCIDQRVGRGLPGESTLCLSLGLHFPISTKKE